MFTLQGKRMRLVYAVVRVKGRIIIDPEITIVDEVQRAESKLEDREIRCYNETELQEMLNPLQGSGEEFEVQRFDHTGKESLEGAEFNSLEEAQDAYNAPTKHQARKEMAEIQAWLNANDYRCNKYIRGEYHDGEMAWEEYKAEAAAKLRRFRELESLVNE